MAAAKINSNVYKKFKKKVKGYAGKFFPSSSNVPGQMDYPAISRVLEAQKKRRKLLDEIQ
jgi:hypothetical protein